MNVKLSGTGVLVLAAVAAAGVAVWYGSRKLADIGGAISSAASTAGEWTAQNLTPWKDTNVAYTGVNAVGGAIVSDPAGPGKNADGSWSLGGWLHDVLNPGTAAAVAGMSGPVYSSRAAQDAAVNDARQIDRIIERQQAAAWGGATGSW